MGLAVALVAVGSYELTLAVAAMGALVFVAVTRRNLAAGLALFTFLSFFDQLPGFEALGSVVAKLAGLVLAGFWMLAMLDRRHPVPPVLSEHPAVAGAVLLFSAWVVASSLWASSLPAALSTASRLLQVIILLVITWTAVRERAHFWWLLTAFLTGAVLTAAMGVRGGGGGEDRLAGDFGDPNELASMLVAAIVIGGAVLLLRRGPARWAAAAVIPPMGLALLRTDSQGGLLAFAIALAAGVALAGPARRAVALGVVVILGVAIAFYTIVTPPVAILEVLEGGGGSGREDLWEVALHVGIDHPVGGVGAGNFPVIEPRYTVGNLDLERVDLVVTPEVAHNTYLHLFAEYGLVGLSLFLGIVVGCLILARSAIDTCARTGQREFEILVRSTVVAIVALLAAFVFLSAQYEKQLWLLLGLAAASASIATRTGRKELEAHQAHRIATGPVERAASTAGSH